MKKSSLILLILIFAFVSKAQWIPVNSGIINPGPASAIANDGINLYAGVADSLSGGMYRSSDMGASWTPINTGLPSLSVWCITTSGSNIFISIVGWGIFVSTDYGNTWNAINTGLGSAYVSTIVVRDSVVYAGTVNAGVYKSIIGGSYNWTAINSGLGSLDVKAIVINDNNDIFAGTQIAGWGLHGVYVLANGASSWLQVNSGMTGSCPDFVSAFIIKDDVILAAAGLTTYLDPPSVFASNSMATSSTLWSNSNTGMFGNEVHSFHSICNVIFAGCGGGYVFYSLDKGQTWTWWDAPSSTYIVSQTSMDSILFVAGGGFFKRDASDFCQEEEEVILEMPNVFSPNSDGANDHFHAIEISGISEAMLSIYNRWGVKLAETDNLTLGWDGKYKNTDCSDGTYFWTINYTTIEEKSSAVIKGHVTLIK